MENKHTPEPWELHEDVQDGQFMIAMATSIDHSGSYEPQHSIEWDYGLYPQDGDQYEEGKANAERIVACVNALAGIEDPEKWVSEHKDLAEENRRLKFMIDNGLGWEDMKNDIELPKEL